MIIPIIQDGGVIKNRTVIKGVLGSLSFDGH
jgi:hypothetical protein